MLSKIVITLCTLSLVACASAPRAVTPEPANTPTVGPNQAIVNVLGTNNATVKGKCTAVATTATGAILYTCKASSWL